MNRINNEQLKKIKGGAVNWGVWAALGGLASFVIGLVDGFVHTKKCNQ